MMPKMRFSAQAKVTNSRKAPGTQRITEIRAGCNLRRFGVVESRGLAPDRNRAGTRSTTSLRSVAQGRHFHPTPGSPAKLNAYQDSLWAAVLWFVQELRVPSFLLQSKYSAPHDTAVNADVHAVS